jgi:hypothetical protein
MNKQIILKIKMSLKLKIANTTESNTIPVQYMKESIYNKACRRFSDSDKNCRSGAQS